MELLSDLDKKRARQLCPLDSTETEKKINGGHGHIRPLKELDYKRQYRQGLGLQGRGSLKKNNRSFTVCLCTDGDESSRKGVTEDEEQRKELENKSQGSVRTRCSAGCGFA